MFGQLQEPPPPPHKQGGPTWTAIWRMVSGITSESPEPGLLHLAWQGVLLLHALASYSLQNHEEVFKNQGPEYRVKNNRALVTRTPIEAANTWILPNIPYRTKETGLGAGRGNSRQGPERRSPTDHINHRWYAACVYIYMYMYLLIYVF